MSLWRTGGVAVHRREGRAESAARVRAEALEPRLLLATFAVTNNRNDGVGSFRQTILNANAAAGADTIRFNITGGVDMVKTIGLLFPLPAVTGPVVIDGNTQPGWTANRPVVQLSGLFAGEGANGLEITGGGTTVRGLIVNTFDGNGIWLRGGSGNVVEGCWVGLDATGALAPGNDSGIVLSGSADARIGGTAAGARNVISGNRVHGIDSDAARTTVVGNYLGTNAAGTAAVSTGTTGINLRGGNATVGGTTAAGRNVICGFNNGISILGAAARANTVLGNTIGLLPDGDTPAGNFNGVTIHGGSDNLIGGAAPGAGNVISNDGTVGTAGVGVVSAARTRIEGNFIGTNRAGTAARGNGLGIHVREAEGTIVGGPNDNQRNVISGNSRTGVQIVDSDNCFVLGNYIGTDVTGRVALGNEAGVAIIATSLGATGNVIGGDRPFPGRAPGNVISGNTSGGVSITGANASGNAVQGNVIGLNAAGTARLANRYGVLVGAGAHDNTVGTSADLAAPGRGNIISGNTDDGVRVSGRANRVAGNFIGTNAAGDAALGNGAAGVYIGGTGATDAGNHNQVADNLISGNGSGVVIFGPRAASNLLTGNRIGTNAAVTAALPNAQNGVLVDGGGNNNVIGDVEPGATGSTRLANVISGNGAHGIHLVGSWRNQVLSNSIGTDPTGTRPLGNGGSGVVIAGGSDFTIIYLGTIAHNAAAGVLVSGGRGNRIGGTGIVPGLVVPPVPEGVSIHSNGGLGIDLGGAGVTPNDPGDGDMGPNDLQNFPVLTNVTNTGAPPVVSGTLSSTPGELFRIEFFASRAPDPSGHGEGRLRVGTADVRTDAAGNASFVVPMAAVVAGGQRITATATGMATEGSTSEFSNAIVVPPDTTPPQVRQVGYAGAWTVPFRQYLQDRGLGTQTTGYALPPGAAQAGVLPWDSAVSLIVVTFTEPVTVDAADLVVRGVNRASYAVASFEYDPVTYSAGWRLAVPAANDKLMIELSGAGAGVIADAVGLSLDGEWSNGDDVYPSGNGTPGGDFRFRLNVLSGDADRNGRVNALDLADVRRRLNRSTTDPGTGGGAYGLFADLTGDGRINALDLAAVRRNLNRILPAAQPAGIEREAAALPTVAGQILGED